MSLRTAFGSLLAMTLICPAPSVAQQPLPPPDSVRLHQILAQNWAYTMHEHPEDATHPNTHATRRVPAGRLKLALGG